jgi:hypothetical protein
VNFYFSFPFLFISLPRFFWKHLFYLHLLLTPKKELNFLAKKLFLYFFANTAWLLATLHSNPFMLLF